MRADYDSPRGTFLHTVRFTGLDDAFAAMYEADPNATYRVVVERVEDK